ncbi:MAG: winged helix-turn-helix domain-containing protein [Planctomycetota bacterium]
MFERPPLNSAAEILAYIGQLESEWPTAEEWGFFAPQERLDAIWTALDALGIALACPRVPSATSVVRDGMDEAEWWRDFRDALRTAKRALLTVAGSQPASPGREAVAEEPEAEEPSEPEPRTVAMTPEEKTILETLANEGSMTVTQEALAVQTHLSDKTVRKYVGELRERGLVDQPRGPKKGFAITPAGSAAIGRK